MAESKLAYAKSDVTVHVTSGSVESQFGTFEIVEGRNLRAGETVALDSLASYQREAVEKGESLALESISEGEAKKRAEDMARMEALLNARGVDQHLSSLVLVGDDGSYSDHRVADDERVANHANRAKEEAGEAGTDDKVTVPGAETMPSGATEGERSGSGTVAENVQGSEGQEAADQSGNDSGKKSKK